MVQILSFLSHYLRHIWKETKWNWKRSRTNPQHEVKVSYENWIRRGISGVHGSRYFGRGQEKELQKGNVKICCGLSLTQPSPYADIAFDDKASLQTILSTKNDVEIKYSHDEHLKNSDSLNQKTKFFRCAQRLKNRCIIKNKIFVPRYYRPAIIYFVLTQIKHPTSAMVDITISM